MPCGVSRLVSEKREKTLSLLDNIKDFEVAISERLKDLPGSNSHIKLASVNRPVYEPMGNYRTGSVMLLVNNKNNLPHLVMIKRAEDGKVHSGQIAFPGGKAESDESLTLTALRELEEEIGIKNDSINIIGALTRVYIPPSNYMVYPFIATQINPSAFLANASEVQTIFEIPLLSLIANKKIVKDVEHQTTRGLIKAPAFKIDNLVIWGATAMILSEFIDLID